MFTWGDVSGAAKYEFQLAGTMAFSPALVDVTTGNHRATVHQRCSATTPTTGASARSARPGRTARGRPRARSTIDWSDVAAPQSPGDGDTLTYPAPILLNWTSVPGAQKYEVKIATDSNLTSLVGGYPTATGPTDTAASAYSPAEAARAEAPTTGTSRRSTRRTTAARLPDVVVHLELGRVHDALGDRPRSADEVFDPQFSWTPIAGAAYYQVEVNSDPSWAVGLEGVLLGYSVGTSLTPMTLLPGRHLLLARAPL